MNVDPDDIKRLLGEGKQLDALRIAVGLLLENPSDMHSMYEVSGLCLLLGESKIAVEGFKAACIEYMESGNLPMGIACIKGAEDAGADAADLKRLAARLYGKGSSRVRNMAMPVPPLPSGAGEERLAGIRPGRESLVREAQKAITLAEESAKVARSMGAALAPLPYFPLFGALAEESFIALLDCFGARAFYADEVIIRQGEIARDLYLLARGEVKVFIAEKVRERDDLAMEMRTKHIATLGPGTFIGEMGIVVRAPRSASVQALTGGVLLSASMDSIEGLANRVTGIADILVGWCEVRLLENVMAVSPILRPLEIRRRVEALGMFDRIYIPAGEAIIKEGEPARGIYLVVSGEVGVTKIGKAPGAGGEERSDTAEIIFITTLSSGDVVGEISTVMRKPATATVHAVTDAALLFIPKERFMEFTRLYPEVFQRLYEIISAREEEIARILESKTSSGGDLLS